ncbi:brachyurin-like [Trichoplusia ni]|uniref:Brachyurin-like n=1 Tax=Trichoplusia ni TaxID=7111 RepID=A0A7E5VPZ7_TRINI|nr:brachyurin-like [Trichoplusia ni]
MRLLISVVYLALATTVSADETFDINDAVYNYHARIGIPEANRIRESENRQNKVVGGSITDVKYVPYQAGLVIEIIPSFTSVCGGSLISATRVLTAAHCKNDGFITASIFTVVLGSNTLFRGGLRIVTNDVVIHPRWDPRIVANDIAVIRINPVCFTDVIQPINLPSVRDIFNDFVDYNAVVSGYGITADGSFVSDNQVISSVTVPVITNNECRAFYANFITSSIICTSGAGGKGACRGDSGGPLAATIADKPVLIGLSSFGSSISCSQGFPSAFTRITSFVTWIHTI